ncbi:MAG: hypothetical protein IJV99_00325, partial [Clostridia bacterium]|nr:hypothetical protein [Clostridia bacterium]
TDVASAITLADSKLSIDPSKLVVAESDLVVVMRSGSDVYKITIPVRVADFAIKTEEEFIAWRTAAQQSYSKITDVTQDIYALLDGDVVLTQNLSAQVANTAMRGELDGQGYSIKGISFENKSSHYLANTFIEFTFKNIAMYSTYFYRYFFNATTPTGASLNLENCYFNLTGVYTSFGHIGSIFNNITNVVVEENDSYGSTVFRTYVPLGKVENFVMIHSSLTSMTTGTGAYTQINSAYFTSMDAFKTDLASATPTVDTSKFDSNWWTIGTDKVPVFKAKTNA